MFLNPLRISTPEINESTVNHDARKERQEKLFGKAKSTLARYKQFRARVKRHTQNARTRFSGPLHGLSPAQRIFQRSATAAFVLILINSVNLTSAAYDTGGIYINGYDYLAIEQQSNLVLDSEGYFTKIMGSEGDHQWTNRGKSFVDHEVQPGQTLSVIAYRYDLSMQTILDANPGIGGGSYLKVGQVLRIPPGDGIEHTVAKGDTWDSLIKKYKTEVEQDEVIAWNDDNLVAGEKVFILGGKKPYVAPPTYARNAGTSGVRPPSAASAAPVPGGWIRPTQGTLTQGYHSWHYAYDIADSSMPGIYAAKAGTIVEAHNDGGWHGGYGNFIIIDHGDGYQTLYAHNSEVYVNPGDYVGQGQLIAKMGRTGRVYGRTGIHLHFELIQNGRKISPAPVFGW